MRFGAELVFSLCETFNTEVIIINPHSAPLTVTWTGLTP
jgi:predicted site-specific integrase-resolvase